MSASKIQWHKRCGVPTPPVEEDDIIKRSHIGMVDNILRTNQEYSIIRHIKHCFSDVLFDLIVYTCALGDYD